MGLGLSQTYVYHGRNATLPAAAMASSAIFADLRRMHGSGRERVVRYVSTIR